MTTKPETGALDAVTRMYAELNDSAKWHEDFRLIKQAITPQKQGWRPISEAPRDGAMFYTDKGELAAFIVDRQRFEFWRAPGQMFTATHYMPLPAAPGGE